MINLSEVNKANCPKCGKSTIVRNGKLVMHFDGNKICPGSKEISGTHFINKPKK